MKKYISKFHYITQDLRTRSHLKQATIACEAGANWIQYRCLTKPDEELVDEINEIASLCDDWGTTLILTNHILKIWMLILKPSAKASGMIKLWGHRQQT
jgi:thiamine-phosphate pyrophosphorylase